MTLFIACLIIHANNMPWWLYPVALITWFIHTLVHKI